MDDAGEELRIDALQRLDRDQRRTTSKNLKVAWTFSTGVNRGPGSGAARRRRHDVRRHAVPEHPLRARPDEARRAAEVEVRAQARRRRRRASPAATSSTAAPSTPTARSSSTRSTATSSRVDAETGKELWKTKVGDINIGETMTMAPLVVKGKVLVGNTGGEFGVRGWLEALDAASGKRRLDAPTAPARTATC